MTQPLDMTRVFAEQGPEERFEVQPCEGAYVVTDTYTGESIGLFTQPSAEDVAREYNEYWREERARRTNPAQILFRF